jgi:hypothetical protein
MISKVIKFENVRAEIYDDKKIRFSHINKEGFSFSLFNEHDLNSIISVCNDLIDYFDNENFNKNCDFIKNVIISTGYNE